MRYINIRNMTISILSFAFCLLSFPVSSPANANEMPYTVKNITTGNQVDFYAEFSPDGKRIVFSSKSGTPEAHDFRKTADNYWNIWVMDADGKNKRQLTTGKVSDLSPVFTLNGEKIIFSSNRGGRTTDLWSIRSDGSELIRLTSWEWGEYAPHVTPDGKGIIYIANEGGLSSVWRMDLDGKNSGRLTSGGFGDYFPLMNPDGKEIVFVSTRLANGDIWTIDAEGKSYKRLTYENFPEFSPVWSPDGSKIAYVTREGGMFDIWVMERDGSNKRRLTKGISGGNWDDRFSMSKLLETAGYYHLSWHPDGTKIAFTTWGSQGKAANISLLEFDEGILNALEKKGSAAEYTLIGERELTKGDWEDFAPSFSPDGASIIFTSNRSGNWDLWRIWIGDCGLGIADCGSGVKGKDLEQITKETIDEVTPVYSPNGKEIAFLSEIPNSESKSETQNPKYSLWIMKSNGDQKKRLTQEIPVLSYPEWNPNGKEIIFVGDSGSGPEIWMCNVASRSLKKMASIQNTAVKDIGKTKAAEYPFKEFFYRVDYNAAGDRIAFESNRSGNINIWTMNVDGTDIARVTKGGKPHWNPVFSPNGKKLAYATSKYARRAGRHNWLNYNIWLADMETGEEMVITGEEQKDWNPVWSPDGKKLAYVTNRSGEFKHNSIWLLYLK